MASNSNLAEIRYINWSAVIAGSVLTLAITAILVPFGNGVGLSVTSPLHDANAREMIFGISLWICWMQIISSICGGYFAGKIAGENVNSKDHEAEFRDGLHGLLAWGLSTVLTAIGVSALSFFTALTPHHVNEVVRNPELTRKAGLIFGFTIGASSFVSAVAAWYYATVGGEHRKKSVDFSRYISFRRTK